MAFLTLELQTKGKTCLIPPNDPNDTKKIYKIGISYILAFHLAFATFIGLFQFFWGPWSLRSPVARISDISDPFIIRKYYCWKFPIFDHCVWCWLWKVPCSKCIKSIDQINILTHQILLFRFQHSSKIWYKLNIERYNSE